MIHSVHRKQHDNLLKLGTKMRTQKFISPCDGHRVEVIINIPDDCDKTYDTVPDPVADNFCQDIEMEERSGTFQDVPDDFFGEEYKLSGSWRILEPDYELIYRIIRWWTNHYNISDFNRNLFIQHFGEISGNDYYDQWIGCGEDLMKMFGRFVGNREDGQTFCNMIMEQVERSEGN